MYEVLRNKSIQRQNRCRRRLQRIFTATAAVCTCKVSRSVVLLLPLNRRTFQSAEQNLWTKNTRRLAAVENSYRRVYHSVVAKLVPPLSSRRTFFTRSSTGFPFSFAIVRLQRTNPDLLNTETWSSMAITRVKRVYV